MRQRILILSIIVGALAACGDFLDMDVRQPVTVDSISLPQRVITLFEGDRYAIPVVVKPDSAFTSTSFYWQSANDSVAMFLNDSLWALREGVTQAFVRTATGDHSDTCTVCVLPPLFVEPGLYPYDMVIYASVNVHGTKITRDNADQYPVAAYVRNELRGIGVMHSSGQRFQALQTSDESGTDYMVIRIWSPYESGEKVTLRCYERPQARCHLFPDTLTFDGERHGTLSDLYPLTFDDKAEE